MREDGSVDTSKFKIVYVAPMKALVAEMVQHYFPLIWADLASRSH